MAMAAFSRIKIAGMNPAPHLVLVGAMGAGKTSIGRRLAERMGLQFADVDEAIERRTGTRVTTIFDCEGEAGFRVREREMLAELLHGPPCVIATGGGAVLAPENRTLLHARGFVVWLQVDLASQRQRLARDRSRPLLQTPDRDAVLRRLADERAPFYAGVADLAFPTDGLTAHEAADALGALLATQWHRSEAAA
jgi:shikimate kinase